ncbi:Uridine diphosphate glycosyltransferase 74E2 [Prunus dulcis]|uniref:Uridine diphosphate glycosyltransferase 74E2 n=1 Tax=Prunus dulcis TaxID=3755 RepID=A0A4Y1QYH1_PRUDU|nr:Uridine diphosphate glycosyltransferase 74E2 [Prunus dulcis]
MIKFRLMDSNRWRAIKVEIEQNHLISPTSGKFYKSHKSMSSHGMYYMTVSSELDSHKH